MDMLDKLVAQHNGANEYLPAFHKYVINFKPLENSKIKIVSEDGKLYAMDKKENKDSFFFRSGDQKEVSKILIDKSQLIFNYAFYYDDSNETEEDRLKIVNELKTDYAKYAINLNKRLQLYFGEQISFEKQVIKEDYAYTPQFSYSSHKQEVDSSDEEKIDSSKGFVKYWNRINK